MSTRSGRDPTSEVRSPAPAQLLALYHAHATEVYRYLSRLTGGDQERTEDLTQSVFERAAAALAQRDDELGPGWLMTTARYAFMHDLRHDRRERRRLECVGSWRADAAADDSERRLMMRSLMQSLTDVQRAALVFRYHDDLPVRQVAALLDRTVEATESLLVRARDQMRDVIKEVDDGA